MEVRGVAGEEYEPDDGLLVDPGDSAQCIFKAGPRELAGQHISVTFRSPEGRMTFVGGASSYSFAFYQSQWDVTNGFRFGDAIKVVPAVHQD